MLYQSINLLFGKPRHIAQILLQQTDEHINSCGKDPFPNPRQTTRLRSSLGRNGILIGTSEILQSAFRPFFFVNLRLYLPLNRDAGAIMFSRPPL
ncbi:MAG: hypothetical protein LBI54_04610 [Lachnospiraceae bacterium]|nr:hypothetical protein [Lachnospiraceae bacterium]